PLVQVMFQLLQYAPEPLQLAGLESSDFPYGDVTTRFDLDCHIYDYGDVLSGRMIYDVNLYDRVVVRQLTEAYQQVLRAVVSRPDQPVRRMELLAPAQRDMIVRRWNDTAVPVPGA